ncbi:MAG: hypothetical protein ABI858_06820 [Pseudoxanthomonas sp.]
MTRRRKITLLVIAAAILVGALVIRSLLDPAYLVPKLLAMAGDSLGLEITASGSSDYRLRGTPELTARKVIAREPGGGAILLQAERVYIAVPWSTLRSRGAELSVDRIELDAPVLDAAALQRWLSKRPPSQSPLPTLSSGIGITRGRITGDGWKVDNLGVDLLSLAPEKPLRAHLSGLYSTGLATTGLARASTRVPFDVHATLTRPTSGAGIGVVGQLSIESTDWRMPSTVRLSAKLLTEDGFQLQHTVLGSRSRLLSGATNLPFAIGIAGTLRADAETILLEPAGLATIGADAMPTLTGSGDFSWGDAVRINLAGTLADWPSAWPALPPPLGRSASPLPFQLAYDGANDFSDVASLHMQRDETVFDGRFRLTEMLDWMQVGSEGSLLPPLTGQLKTPRLEVSGATLEGVEIQIEEPTLPPSNTKQ